MNESTDTTRVRSLVVALCLIPLVILSLYSLTLAVKHGSFHTWAGGDFHPYWYWSHFVRQGTDPYAYENDHHALRFPLHYLDGVTVDEPPATHPGLSGVLANTAPILFITLPFSFFSWPVARTMWLILNLIVVLATPWMVIRLLPGGRRLPATARALIFFAFYAFYPTRISIELGQTSLVVFAAMLGALLVVERSSHLSGVLLGISLCKYSVSLPAVAFLAIARRYKSLVFALAFQTAGILLIAALDEGSVTRVLQAYGKQLHRHAEAEGIHLLWQFPDIDPALVGMLAGGAGLFVAFIALRLFRLQTSGDSALWCPESFQILNLLMLTTLLAAYHGAYDAVAAILFFATAIQTLMAGSRSPLSAAERMLLALFLAASTSLMCLPTLPGKLLPNMSVTDVLSWTVVSMLLASTWLFVRTTRAPKTPHRPN